MAVDGISARRCAPQTGVNADKSCRPAAKTPQTPKTQAPVNRPKGDRFDPPNTTPQPASPPAASASSPSSASPAANSSSRPSALERMRSLFNLLGLPQNAQGQ